MKNELNKLLLTLKVSSSFPLISTGGWFREMFIDFPSKKFYLYVPNREVAIEVESQIDYLWKKEKKVFNNIPKEYFERQLYSHVLEKFESGQNFEEKDWQTLISYYSDQYLFKFEIFKELKGCSITSKQPIIVSNFKLYSWPKHKKIIKTNYPLSFRGNSPSFYDEKKEITLVSVIIEAKVSGRAHELAEDLFKRFENILRYLFSDPSYSKAKTHDLGIFDFRKKDWSESYDLSHSSTGGIFTPIGTSQNFKFNSKTLVNKVHMRKIWSIVSKKNLSKIEIRLLNAIEWIGKAKHEIEKEKAFILYFFSIESLLNFTDNGLVTPSLTHQMKEYTAFILGKNKAERIEIDKNFSNLYGIRSSIVHGTLKEITKYEMEDVRDIAERLVILESYLLVFLSKNNGLDL